MNPVYLTALITGLAGSLHCVGMCGPIAMALPLSGNSFGEQLRGRLMYNSGRIITYALLGVIAGSLGHALHLAGIQQSLSIIAGVIILLIASQQIPMLRLKIFYQSSEYFFGWMRSLMGKLLKLRAGNFILGSLNGLLPCGFVYIALAGAISAGGSWQGALFMLLFGLGTWPLMLLMGFSSKFMSMDFRRKLNRYLPYFVLLIGVLFILRGMNLGIPYLSPEVNEMQELDCCRKPRH